MGLVSKLIREVAKVEFDQRVSSGVGDVRDSVPPKTERTGSHVIMSCDTVDI